MKRLLVVAALLALTAPAALAAPPTGKGKPSSTPTSVPSPSALCKQQRRAMGMSAFRALYAPIGSPKAAFDACLGKLSTQVSTNAKNAAKQCKAERDQDPAAFATKYGTNGNSGTNGYQKNAFGKCVSSLAKQQTQQEQQETLSAAKTCKTERGNTPDSVKAFEDKYGTGNKKNAFGKCVAAAKKQQESGG